MSEMPNDQLQENKKTLDNLNNSSESFTDSLENIEDKLNIDNDDIKVSDDIRAAYLKINSLSRSGEDNTTLESDYSKIMDKYTELSSRSFESQQEYIDATKQLLQDLSTLELSTGEKLGDKSIDGGLFEAGIALKDGIIKAGEKIYEELNGYFEMIGMAGDLPEIIEKIISSLSFDTLSDIYNALVDMGGDTIRDFNLILKNSTQMGKAVELSHFVPSVGIPLLFDSVGPGKFFKILKIDKFIPEKVLKAMSDIKEKGKDTLGKVFKKSEKVDVKSAEKIGDKVDADTIRNNFSISDNETRKIAAVDTVKQKYGDDFKGFTPEQLDGIIEAHEIGKELFTEYLQKNGLKSVEELSDSQLREIFNSKEGRIALRQKMKKLQESGIDMKYSDDLIRAGITGGETASTGIRIMSDEALKDLQKSAKSALGNLSKLPDIGQRIKTRSLTQDDIKILDEMYSLAKAGHLSSKENVNKTLIEVINKAKIGESHPALDAIFKDLSDGVKTKNLEKIVSGEFNGFGSILDLYKTINKSIGDIDVSAKLEKIDGFINVEPDELSKISQTISDIMKIDFATLFDNGVNINSIKPIQYILRYGGTTNQKFNYEIGLIINKVINRSEISVDDIQFLKKNMKDIVNDDRLLNISKGKLENAGLIAKKEASIITHKIPEEKISQYGSFGTYSEVESGIKELVLDGNIGINELLNNGNKSILEKLLNIKDQLWEEVSDVNGLKKELHNNIERKTLLQSLGLGNSEIDLLDEACLI